ncbi:MAG: M16 family metallopeptidase [Planctomycetota bacterium]|jgi:zinc protease
MSKSTLAAKAALTLAMAAASAMPAMAQDVSPQGKAPAAKKAYEKIEIPALRSFTTPTPERVELSNGMVLFLLEDHELPVIDMAVSFRGGSGWEMRSEAGLTGFMASVMRSGGTTSLPGDALDEKLESLAASIEVGAGLTQVTVSLSSLKDEFEGLLPLMLDVIQNPAFPQEKLDLAKTQALSGLARRNDDPGDIASREFDRALFSDDLPFGWTQERDTIKPLTREHLIARHKDIFFANRAVAGIVGDFDAAAMKKTLEAVFNKLPSAEEKLADLPKVAGEAKPRVVLIDRPEINQTNIFMGHVGVQRTPDDPDYFAVVVANNILGGGGFSSRLLQNVRTDLGLAYSVYSYFQAPYTHRGRFALGCQTKSETTFKALRAMLSEVERIAGEPVSAEELAVAKESILQSLVFSNAQRSSILERATRYEINNFPQDYLDRFQAGIAKVTVADVQAAAKKHMRPEAMVYVLVGKVDRVGQRRDRRRRGGPRRSSRADQGQGDLRRGGRDSGRRGHAARRRQPSRQGQGHDRHTERSAARPGRDGGRVRTEATQAQLDPSLWPGHPVLRRKRRLGDAARRCGHRSAAEPGQGPGEASRAGRHVVPQVAARR